ncbi:hypothetical protein, partial [Burkholderia pseudomallei]|uniref:hypothetical protein n=1 Tax=Burkholderia pseudomallei TaxID=28450 RepID=UPI00201B2FF9
MRTHTLYRLVDQSTVQQLTLRAVDDIRAPPTTRLKVLGRDNHASVVVTVILTGDLNQQARRRMAQRQIRRAIKHRPGKGDNDLPPTNRASRSLVKFVFGEKDEHEEALYGTANHRVSEGSRGR